MELKVATAGASSGVTFVFAKISPKSPGAERSRRTITDRYDHPHMLAFFFGTHDSVTKRSVDSLLIRFMTHAGKVPSYVTIGVRKFRK